MKLFTLHGLSRRIVLFILLGLWAGAHAQPANNNCANAINITDFSGACSNAFNMTGATNDLVTGTCPEGVQQIWYRITPPNTTMTITVNGGPSSRPEIVLGQFTGPSCVAGNWVELLCADQTGNYTTISMNPAGLDCNQEYYIMVTYNSDANFGPGTICVSSLVPPANNQPTGSSVLAGCDTVFTSSNTNANNCGTGFGNCLIPPSSFCSFNDVDNNPATGDAEGADVGVSIENDVWWRFCPSTNNVAYTLTLTPTTCSTVDGIQVAVLQGAANNMPILLAGGINGQNLLVPGPHVLNFTVPSAANGCVFIQVDGFAGAECSFGVNLNCTANCPVCVLPVTITALDANVLGQRVRVSWRTQEEHGTAYHEVLRQDGEGDFLPIGQVEAAGTWAAAYQLDDQRPLDGINRYRIRSVDHDGAVSLSDIVAVDFSAGQPFSIAPNPFSTHLDILQQKAVDGPATLSIHDLSGRLVLRQAIDATQIGSTQRIHAAQLAPGAYHYTLSSRSGWQHGKLIRQ